MRARPVTRVNFAVQVLAVVGLAVALALLPVQCSLWVASLSVLGLVAVSDERRRAKASRIREALSILQISVKKAAEEHMDWDERAFQRALAGEAKLDDWRLEMLPAEFHRIYALLVLRDLGMPELVMTALKIPQLMAFLTTERSA